MNTGPSQRPYELRPAEDADRDAIAEVWHASASLPDVGPRPMPSEAALRHRVDVEMDHGWVVTLAADNEAIVGFLAIRPADATLCELFVRPDYLGNGLGRILLHRAITAMPDGFSLYTRSVNIKARRFYERAGLSVLRHDTHPRTGDPVTHYVWAPE